MEKEEARRMSAVAVERASATLLLTKAMKTVDAATLPRRLWNSEVKNSLLVPAGGSARPMTKTILVLETQHTHGWRLLTVFHRPPF